MVRWWGSTPVHVEERGYCPAVGPELAHGQMLARLDGAASARWGRARAATQGSFPHLT